MECQPKWFTVILLCRAPVKVVSVLVLFVIFTGSYILIMYIGRLKLAYCFGGLSYSSSFLFTAS